MQWCNWVGTPLLHFPGRRPKLTGASAAADSIWSPKSSFKVSMRSRSCNRFKWSFNHIFCWVSLLHRLPATFLISVIHVLQIYVDLGLHSSLAISILWIYLTSSYAIITFTISNFTKDLFLSLNEAIRCYCWITHKRFNLNCKNSSASGA